ncbi:MAG TPA: hypothetical protein ENJ35_10410 [Gammaproteobacteria bacterium]|nr:hypothetical protein [Gammaproteobacteria bacterium]
MHNPYHRSLGSITILLLFIAIGGCSDGTSLSGGGTFQIQTSISSSEADGEESANGTTRLYNQNLNLGYEGNNKQVVGLRFENIDIPRGALIDDAQINFTASAAGSKPTSIIISGIADPQNAPFEETNRNISSRARTSATALWSIPPWKEDQTDQRSPDLSSIIQEIIRLPGWERGDTLAFLLEGRGARSAYSYDQSQDKAPTLEIRYTADSSSGSVGDVFEYRIDSKTDDAQERSDNGVVRLISESLNLGYGIGSMAASNPVVGLRFNNIDIPRNASISKAYVQFTSNLETFEPYFIHLTIQGEASDSALPFDQNSYSISSRPPTNATSYWEPSPWSGRLIAGPDQRTDDISDIISEIIDRPGWQAGNSIALTISGPGEASTRFASAFENDPDFAPLLHIELDK